MAPTHSVLVPPPVVQLAKTSADANEPPGATSLRSAAVADLLEDTEEKRVDAEAVGGRTVSP